MCKKKNLNNLVSLIEDKYFSNSFINNNYVGNIVELKYKIKEGDKERIQTITGLVIGIKSNKFVKNFIIRRIIDGIGIEQIFSFNSPHLISVIKKSASKIRRAKLYFVRFLSGKDLKLKLK